MRPFIDGLDRLSSEAAGSSGVEDAAAPLVLLFPCMIEVHRCSAGVACQPVRLEVKADAAALIPPQHNSARGVGE